MSHIRYRKLLLVVYIRAEEKLVSVHSQIFYNLYQDVFPNRVCTRYDMIMNMIIPDTYSVGKYVLIQVVKNLAV